jgi:hypothetical protein
MNTIRSPEQLTKFIRKLESSSNLDSEKSATTFNFSLSEAAPLFLLPSITNVRLIKSKDWGTSDTVRGSPIDTICLVDCGFDDKALTEIFQWPKSLKSLSFEVNQDEYASHYRGLPPKEFTCATFVRKLFIQCFSLENLTLTRTKQATGLGYSFPIQLSKFTALKTLSTFHVFLIAKSNSLGDNIHARLPRSLEELQIFYDDTNYINFANQTPNWLIVLLQQRNTCLPTCEKSTSSLPRYR